MQCKGLPQALWYAEHTAQCPTSSMNKLGVLRNPSVSPLYKKVQAAVRSADLWLLLQLQIAISPYIHLVQM